MHEGSVRAPHLAALGTVDSGHTGRHIWTVVALCGRRGEIAVKRPTPLFGEVGEYCKACEILNDAHGDAGAREIRVSVWALKAGGPRWNKGGSGQATEHIAGETPDKRKTYVTLFVRDRKLLRRARALQAKAKVAA